MVPAKGAFTSVSASAGLCLVEAGLRRCDVRLGCCDRFGPCARLRQLQLLLGGLHLGLGHGHVCRSNARLHCP